MDLEEILKLNNINPAQCRFARHGNSELIEHGWPGVLELFRTSPNRFEAYQMHLRTGSLDGSKYLLSFAPFQGGDALFLAIYEILSERPCSQHPDRKELSKVFGWPEKGNSYFKMQRLNLLSDLSERLVISWKGHTSWLQKKIEGKKVQAVLAEGSIGDFHSFEETVLSRYELTRMINNPQGNHTWQAALSSVNGVYLITTDDGTQYVGSASGKYGIWGRWATYAKEASGGNKLLKTLLSKSPAASDGFTYSILSVIPGGAKEALLAETRWKKKLGSRVYGLNAN